MSTDVKTKVAIVGFARDGQAAYDFFSTRSGYDITICDADTGVSVPDGAANQLGEDYLRNLNAFDIIVRTAGLHPRLIQEANPEAPGILEKVTGNVDLFFEHSPSQNMIGVTGTKGKGTTSTLIANMLEASGKRVHIGGNIGIPALELLKAGIQPDDWVVLEQSSFQLIDQKHSPHIAVCLMVVPEHLNWHADMDEYIDAKSQLFIHQTGDDIAIYYAQNEMSEDIAAASEGTLIPYYAAPGAEVKDGSFMIEGQTICSTDDIRLLGQHNWQNICAALTAVWQVTQDVENIKQVLGNFSGLEHRLELVRELDSVKYYDDSFGTTPETAIVAIQAFDQPKVVILGGSDKGASFDELARVVQSSNVRKVIAIGDMAQPIGQALNSVGFTNIIYGDTAMDAMVQHCRDNSQSGDVVLLSTGCASFGLFKDYKDRGNQFKQAVLAL